MNIEAKKILLAQQLFAIQQESILDKFQVFLKKEINTAESAYRLSEDENNAIKEGLISLKEKGSISHEEATRQTKLRYPNLFK